MSTTTWTDVNPLQQSSSSSFQPEPRRSAPPIMQQSLVQTQEEVIWDDSMMDLDESDLEPVAQPAPAVEPSSLDIQPVEIGTCSLDTTDDTDPSQIRPEAVHVRGVDHLSTDDVQLWASSLYPSTQAKVEWIDDTSLNIAYVSADIATSALQAFSSAHIEQLPPSTLRPAKPLAGEKSIQGLKVRIACMGDKKVKGARDRSRWYLFNPPPNEDHERRYTTTSNKTNDSHDSRRRGVRRYEPYSRRRSRSRSPPLNYDDQPRNKGVELFPTKVANGVQPNRHDSRSRSPDRRRYIEGSYPILADHSQTPSSSRRPRPTDKDLFPTKIGGIKRAAMDSPLTTAPHKPLSFGKSTGDTTFHNAPVELFPERVSKPMEESKKSLAERIQDDGGARELFPELVSGPGGGRRRRRKAEDHF